jgi:hypothetical protein
VLKRPEVADLLDDEDQLWSGWTAKFAARDIPPGAKLSAWAFDAEEPMLYRLPGAVPFTPPAEPVKTASLRATTQSASLR